ncbi:DNA repair protein RecO [Geitlerinema sp. PCC 9228]|jgi:DNA repair protein RecO (recombination protein O)|uniref:DNA repair protein RecO n=1 Tax=Geitlerinema sp. PCC 9228 TaxID=111611 RepID=UPI0008F9AA03|nr:DNA repair protein RecO [Geitlerinema sp. PCC 9228]
MNKSYKAVGINLKSSPLGESDRLLTILTAEYGIVRAIAPGARKHKSTLRGRSEVFVENELLLYRGRSLHRIQQAQTLASYPSLSQNLGKLTVAQYWAELVLAQAVSEQPQTELYEILTEHLRRLHQMSAPSAQTEVQALLARLCHGIYHLLAVGGIAPQCFRCTFSQQAIAPPETTEETWQVGFSAASGGIVSLAAFEKTRNRQQKTSSATSGTCREAPSSYRTDRIPDNRTGWPPLTGKLNAGELAMLQQLPSPQLPAEWLVPPAATSPSHCQGLSDSWQTIEHLLRQYAQYHLGTSIRSATLLNACITMF